MEELQGLLLKIQGKVDTFNSWAAKLRKALKGQGEDRVGKFILLVICSCDAPLIFLFVLQN
jgi:hypothetical protein